MISFRVLTSAIGRQLISSLPRHFSKAASVRRSIVHQVYPFSNIKITSNYHLDIKPYDILACPDGNLLRISLQPKNPNEAISTKVTSFLGSFDAAVKIDDQNVVIDTVDDLGTQVNADELANAVVCLIEVPVKANLKVFGKRDICINNMYSDDINAITNDGDLTTKNIHAINLSLATQNGNIRCEGTTLAQKIDVRSHGKKVRNYTQNLCLQMHFD